VIIYRGENIRLHIGAVSGTASRRPTVEAKPPSGSGEPPLGKGGSKAIYHGDRKKLEKQLDELWKGAVIKRDGGKCIICGARKSLAAHHILSRRHKSTRWLLENGVTLCTAHHIYGVHYDPVPYVNEFRRRLGNDFLENLTRLAMSAVRYTEDDLLEIMEKLKNAT